VIVVLAEDLLAMIADLETEILALLKNIRQHAPSVEIVVNCLLDQVVAGLFFAVHVLGSKMILARQDAIIEEVLIVPILETSRCTRQHAPNADKDAKFLLDRLLGKMCFAILVLEKAIPEATTEAVANNLINN
jgi:hypothetical protein